MKVLVCGSRNWDDARAIVERMGKLPAGSTIIHGGARGPDQVAGIAADLLGMPVDVHLPDWEHQGKRAGIIRNNEMLDEHPDLVIAFWDGKSTGTGHTIFEARRRGIAVEVFQ